MLYCKRDMLTSIRLKVSSEKENRKWKLCKKRKFREKYRMFKNQMQNFSKKVAKIHQKSLDFENTKLILKEGLSASPTDGFTQRTTRADILRNFHISHFRKILLNLFSRNFAKKFA